MPYNPTWNNPYLQQQQLLQPLYQPQQSVNGVIKVNGRESALQYQLPPNSMSPALFDNNGQVFYVVSTDGTGTKTVETFDFLPHIDKQEQPLDTHQYVTRKKILRYTDQEVSKYGNNRMDTKVVGELADIIKDLAEAEYYCSVAQAMDESDSAGYDGMGDRSGYGSQGSRSGYGSNMMGHHDPMSTIREIMATADPETKMMLRNEINKMM